jgi:hypothetical protein
VYCRFREHNPSRRHHQGRQRAGPTGADRRGLVGRNIEIRSRNNEGGSDQTLACSTVDEFVQLTA